jgi:excisionase family DNA binding protein
VAHVHTPNIPIALQRAYTLGEVAALTRLSIATLYKEISAGRLLSKKLAGRRLVLREDLDAFLRGGGEK